MKNRETTKIDIQINDIDDKSKKSMKTRVIVALIMAVICVPCLFLGGWFWFVLLSVALGIGIYEMIKAPQRKYSWYIWVIVYLLVTSFFIWFVVKSNLNEYEALKLAGKEDEFRFSLEQYCSQINVSIFALGTSICVFLFLAVIHKEFDLHDVCYLFTMSFLIGLGFQAMLIIRYFPTALAYKNGHSELSSDNVFKYWQSAELLVFFLIAVMFNDIYAYFVGVLFGKHKMNPRISPKKTWEGFFGGWVLSAGTAVAFALIADKCGSPVIKGVLDIEHWYWVVLLALALPMSGNLGDFSFSLIKRTYDFKDFGNLLRDHGGILDRIDSILISGIVFAVLLTFLMNGWNFLK